MKKKAAKKEKPKRKDRHGDVWVCWIHIREYIYILTGIKKCLRKDQIQSVEDIEDSFKLIIEELKDYFDKKNQAEKK
jgi:hypothetical protein